jgi:hypothetical protein
MEKKFVASVVCMLSFVSLFSGCVNVPKELTQFSIYSFEGEPGAIKRGESANLSWVVISATTVSINNGIGTVALSGHRIVFPTQNITYILTASNATMTKSASVTIIVNRASNESQEPTEISIASFESTPSIIDLGASANLSWVVTGATSISIDHGIGSVALSGHRIVIPTETTTYTLTASNAFTSKQASVMIQVRTEPSLPQVTPNIACTTDSILNKITILTADVDIRWDDITITTNPINTWRIYYNGGSTALSDNSYPNNAAVVVTASDYIFLYGASVGNVLVTLRYEPTNSLLGSWTVNI